jgi:hypothetical protein
VQIALGPNAGNWRIADTAVLQDLSWGHEYQVIFRVANYVSEGQNDGKPAGFLAQIAGTGVAGGPVLTSSSWQVAVDNPALDYEDQVLTWGPATVYGKNEGPNIWTQNGGPVAGIDLSAEWIWDNRNYSQLAHPYLWVRGTFTTAVPEPGSVLIWSLVIVGSVACARWRRKRRVA